MVTDADKRIAELERQVALLQTQLGALEGIEDSSVEGRLRTLLGDRLVLDSLPGIVNVLDRDQRIVYLNRTIPGRDLRELYGTDARTHIAESDRARYAETFDQAWEQEQTRSIRLRSVSGYHWECTLVPVKEGGKVVFMLVTSSDVTAWLEADRALRESEARLRHALESSGMGTWTYHVADDRVTWDQATADLFGVPMEEAPTTYAEYLTKIHPDDRELVRRSVQRYAESGRYSDLEHRVLLPSGKVRYLLGKGAALLDEQGQTVGFRGGVFDITARKELEAQLQLAQKMQAVGQLTSGIAHNLNNALAVIIPNLEDCRDVASGELAQQVDDMAHAAQRAAEMVRQLMLFVGPNVGVEKSAFDLVATAKRIADMCRKTFDRRIVIGVEAAKVPAVLGNEGQLEQVLLNICLNARDALAGATVATPRIDLRIDAETDGFVRLTVTDNGLGMADDVRSRVFDPFFTTKGVGRGTGLGMATAYAIISDHGGKIVCQSEPGQGTTFELRLPVSGRNGARPAAAPARSEIPSSNERVLLVDDDPSVRRSLRKMLERAGYRVQECEGGPEAVALFETGRVEVDVILLDRSMPGISGEQVLDHLQQLHVTAPVIFLTGDPGSCEELTGIALLLSKPVNRRTLLKAVQSALEESRLG